MEGDFHLNLRLLPSLLIGGGMVTMAFGLLWRSRLAWVMAVLLAATGAVNTLLTVHSHVHVLLAYFAFLLAALLFAWRHSNRSSVAASTLFALTAAIDHRSCCRALLRDGEHEHGGYGDIVPAAPEARLFTISLIVLGVAVFATSLTAVIAPLVSQSLKRHHRPQGNRHETRESLCCNREYRLGAIGASFAEHLRHAGVTASFKMRVTGRLPFANSRQVLIANGVFPMYPR
jgi:voltage-gated potassium channel